MLGIEVQRTRSLELGRVERLGREHEARVAPGLDLALATAALDRDPRAARPRAGDRLHPAEIDSCLSQRREHALGLAIVPDGACVGRAQPETRTGEHRGGHLPPRQLERVGRPEVLGTGGRAVDEEDPVERVLTDPEKVEAPVALERRPERIGIGPGAQYRTR
jgi:hypothetical protein